MTFSESVDPIDAVADANFDLREAGPNGTFGDADDVLWDLIFEHAAGSDTVVSLPTPIPPPGTYRLTISGSSTVHDLSGLSLDGDGDGTPGGTCQPV